MRHTWTFAIALPLLCHCGDTLVSTEDTAFHRRDGSPGHCCQTNDATSSVDAIGTDGFTPPTGDGSAQESSVADVSAVDAAAMDAASMIPNDAATTTDGGSAPDSGITADSGTATASHYGVPWGADGLGNLEIGKSSGRAISIRFRAQHTSSFSQARFYFIFRALGYYAGDGGQVLVQLQSDDGSASHNPSGTTLSSVRVTSPMAGSMFPLLTFDRSVSLVAGQLYHFVFTNPAADPVHNYISLDDLYQSSTSTSAVQPGASNVDFAILWKYSGSDAWAVNSHHTPIVDIRYGDGSVQGQGYVDVWASSAARIGGSSLARETFTVSGTTRTVSRVSMRLTSSSAAGPLTVRLERSDGTLVEQGTIDASAVHTSPTWVSYTFTTPRSLASHASYNLVLSSVSGAYSIVAMQEGTAYGFQASNLFTDGCAQSNTGSGWSNIRGSTAADFPIYFDAP